MRFFATAAKGTEPALRDELRELRLRHVRADRGGVHFEGELADGARACLWSRVAMRILYEVASFEAPDADALYEGTRAVRWDAWMTPESTVAVRATCRSSRLTHSQFVAQRTKDGIVDAVRAEVGARPDVDRDDPDVLVATHLAKDKATLYLDVSGSSLHERGWRRRSSSAPLRETLAAAVLRLSGWDREQPLVDPMCGAGTIAIEAAAWARRLAPGLSRERFGFERWADHGASMQARMKDLRGEARAAALSEGPPIYAGDVDPSAVAWTKENASRAGVSVVAEVRDVRALAPLTPPGFVVTNPPYGERLDADAALYGAMARAFRAMGGHTVALLAGTPALPRAMGKEADKWWILHNGPIECRLLVYSIGTCGPKRSRRD